MKSYIDLYLFTFMLHLSADNVVSHCGKHDTEIHGQCMSVKASTDRRDVFEFDRMTTHESLNNANDTAATIISKQCITVAIDKYLPP